MLQRAITKLLETNEKKMESFSKKIKNCDRETTDEKNQVETSELKIQ